MKSLTSGFKNIMGNTWPIIAFLCIIAVVFRISYINRNNKKFIFNREIPYLFFLIYILCLFQIVTSQDVSGTHGINLTFFQELTRYSIGTRLFYRNIVGNIVLFIPFGFFIAYVFKIDKRFLIFLLTGLASLTIETIQLSIGRAFDVDDIILNVLGGMLGYFIYHIINIALKKISQKKRDNLISIILVIVVISIFVVIL